MNTTDPFRNALILSGPTASGKTALSLELAQRLNAEIVVMDSMTLYRGMDIGTAKPTAAERETVPHHLLDQLDPWEAGNVAWWRERAALACAEIESRGKTALLVGGTPFYLKAILHGLFDSPPADAELRKRLETQAAELGPESLHRRLVECDPVSATRLHANDVRRVVRALEVWELTGKPLSEWQTQSWWGESKAAELATVDGMPRCIVIDLPREELGERIDRRIDTMFAQGWLDEVRGLLTLPQGMSQQASQAVGYSEIIGYLGGKYDWRTMLEGIRTRTRQFAKHQRTWFRRLPVQPICERKLTFDLWRRKMT